jgi:hypothetical protein
MVLFQINDIRLFWSEDERFLSQFSVSGLDVSSAPVFCTAPIKLNELSPACCVVSGVV